jgi:hypothetical protein
MRKLLALKILLSCLVLVRFAAAQDKPVAAESASQSKAKAAEPSANRKAYDALYSDIIKTLPQDGKSKIDSARGREAKPDSKQSGKSRSAEELKKEAFEKRKRELEDLPPEVKARVDKVMSDLDNRRKDKQAEFKELKE